MEEQGKAPATNNKTEYELGNNADSRPHDATRLSDPESVFHVQLTLTDFRCGSILYSFDPVTAERKKCYRKEGMSGWT